MTKQWGGGYWSNICTKQADSDQTSVMPVGVPSRPFKATLDGSLSRCWWRFRRDVVHGSPLWPTWKSRGLIFPHLSVFMFSAVEGFKSAHFHKCQNTRRSWDHFVLLSHTNDSCPGWKHCICPPTELHRGLSHISIEHIEASSLWGRWRASDTFALATEQRSKVGLINSGASRAWWLADDLTRKQEQQKPLRGLRQTLEEVPAHFIFVKNTEAIQKDKSLHAR